MLLLLNYIYCQKTLKDLEHLCLSYSPVFVYFFHTLIEQSSATHHLIQGDDKFQSGSVQVTILNLLCLRIDIKIVYF